MEGWMSKWSVRCTSTLFPQLIGIIIGDLGQVVSEEKRTQTTTRQTYKFPLLDSKAVSLRGLLFEFIIPKLQLHHQWYISGWSNIHQLMHYRSPLLRHNSLVDWKIWANNLVKFLCWRCYPCIRRVVCVASCSGINISTKTCVYMVICFLPKKKLYILEAVSSLPLCLPVSGGDQMMPQGIIWNSLSDTSRHHQGVQG